MDIDQQIREIVEAETSIQRILMTLAEKIGVGVEWVRIDTRHGDYYAVEIQMRPITR